MFPGCPEHCNAEGTHSKYSRNIVYRLGRCFTRKSMIEFFSINCRSKIEILFLNKVTVNYTFLSISQFLFTFPFYVYTNPCDSKIESKLGELFGCLSNSLRSVPVIFPVVAVFTLEQPEFIH